MVKDFCKYYNINYEDIIKNPSITNKYNWTAAMRLA